jgi:hypothetical protein
VGFNGLAMVAKGGTSLQILKELASISEVYAARQDKDQRAVLTSACEQTSGGIVCGIDGLQVDKEFT